MDLTKIGGDEEAEQESASTAYSCGPYADAGDVLCGVEAAQTVLAGASQKTLADVL